VERHVLEEIVLPQLDTETGKPIVTSHMRFLEVAEGVDRDTILGAERGERSGEKLDAAEGWLRHVLADGDWHESAGVKRRAGSAGLSERTLQRAFKDLEIQAERRGFPSETWWQLPQSRQPLSTQLGATVEAASAKGLEPAERPVAPSLSGIGNGATEAHGGGFVFCSKHAKETRVERVAAGVTFLACAAAR